MDNEWNQIDSFQEMKVLKHVIVLRPVSHTSTPLFCNLCKFPLKTLEDSICYRNIFCCEKCFLFCRGEKEQIKEEQWKEYLQEREMQGKPLLIFK